MKRVFLCVSVVTCFIYSLQAQCTVDPNAQTSPGISPLPDQNPCVIAGTPYQQTIQVKNLSSMGAAGFSATVDSMRLDSVAGLPAGISWVRTPVVLYGGQNGCLTFTGTTNDAPGAYNLTWYGIVWAQVPFIGAQTYSGNLSRFGRQFAYYLHVINPGDPCVPIAAGVNDVNPELNTELAIYPNPNTGIFTLKLNAGKRVNGEVVIVDMTGRIVYSQKLDVVGLYDTSVDLTNFAKGLYTLQLRTADGFISKNISIE
jgi:hypothetical protein